MTLVFTYDGNDLGNTVVRLGSISGFTQLAELGSVGSSTIVLDDPDGSLVIVGLKRFTVDELDAPAGNQRVYTGFTGQRTYRRGAGDRPSLITGAGREIEVALSDLNAVLSFKVITGTDGKRPAETAAARGTWLLASGYVDVFDNGLVVIPTTAMDANDYRGQRPADVLGDMAVATACNFFVYYDESADQDSLWFGNSNTSALYTSALQISNILADVDSNVVDGVGPTQTWAPKMDAAEASDPSRVVAGVYLPYANSFVYETLPSTATAFGWRDGVAANSNVKTKTKAVAIANQFLADNSTEDDRVTVSVQVTSANVNDLNAGQLQQSEFLHLPPYDVFSYFRALRVSKAQDEMTPDLYTLSLDLSPATPPVDNIVQRVGWLTLEGGATLTFPANVTIGNILVVAVSDRGNTDPTGPNVSPSFSRWGAGTWTKAAGGPWRSASSGNVDGCNIYYKVADSTNRSCFFSNTRTQIQAWEIQNTTLTGLAIVGQDEHGVSSPMTIGSLGTAAPGSVAVAVICIEEENFHDNVVGGTGWTTARQGPGIMPYGVYSYGHPWSWFGEAQGTGASLTAAATKSVGGSPASWGAVAIIFPSV